MSETRLHPGLEARLTALAMRIVSLRQKVSRSTGVERIEASSELKELERRYTVNGERLRSLNEEGRGFRQNAKAELEKISDTIVDMLEDFAASLDRSYRTPHRHQHPMTH